MQPLALTYCWQCPKYQKVHPFFWKHMNFPNSQRITSQKKKWSARAPPGVSVLVASLSAASVLASADRDRIPAAAPSQQDDIRRSSLFYGIYIHLAWNAEKVRDQRKQRGRKGDQFDKNLGFCLQYFECEDFEVLNKLIWHSMYIDPALAWIKASVSEHRRSTSLFSKRMACNLVFPQILSHVWSMIS